MLTYGTKMQLDLKMTTDFGTIAEPKKMMSVKSNTSQSDYINKLLSQSKQTLKRHKTDLTTVSEMKEDATVETSISNSHEVPLAPKKSLQGLPTVSISLGSFNQNTDGSLGSLSDAESSHIVNNKIRNLHTISEGCPKANTQNQVHIPATEVKLEFETQVYGGNMSIDRVFSSDQIQLQ